MNIQKIWQTVHPTKRFPLEQLRPKTRKPPVTETRIEFKLLHEEVKDSSDKNRQFFFGYLFLITYILVVVLSTSEKMLLRSFDGIKMPFVDMMLPLLGFYWTVPLLVLGLHFNLLHNLKSHHFKLTQWRLSFPDQRVPRSLIHAFLFDFAELEHKGSLIGFARWINAILFFYLGPITLAAILFKLAKYQSAPLTAWHMVAFGLNVFLVWRTKCEISVNRAAERENFEMAVKPSKQTVDKQVAAAETFFQRTLTLIHEFLIGLLNFIFTASKPIFTLLVFLEGALSIAIATCSSQFYLEYFLPSIPTEYNSAPKYRWEELILPRIYVDRTDAVFEINEAAMKTAAAETHQSNWVAWFLSEGHGIDLRNRSLRSAQLSGQHLIRASFYGAQMEGATLFEDDLEGADFTKAFLHRANFSLANLNKSNFFDAQMENVMATGVSVENAYFNGAKLDGAYFKNVLGRSANFSGAYARGVTFEGGHLQGANFNSSILNGSSFDGAHLEGAYMQALRDHPDNIWGHAWGVSFVKAKLQGVHFEGMRLQGSDFTDAAIDGVNFDGTNLQGVMGLNSQAYVAGNGPMIMAQPSKPWGIVELEKKYVPIGKFRDDFEHRIQLAAQQKPLTANELPKSDAKKIAERWVDAVCKAPSDEFSSDVFLGQSDYYKRLTAKYMSKTDDLEANILALLRVREDKKVTENFKHLICTSPKCTPLRNTMKADGKLDCNAPVTLPKFDSGL